MSKHFARLLGGIVCCFAALAAAPQITMAQTAPAGTAPAAVLQTPTPPSSGKVEVKTPSTVPTPPEGTPALSAPPPQSPLPVISPDRYFVLIFGAESSPKRAKYTHTFLTIVKATPNLDVEDTYNLEVHTISWLPRSLDIRVLKLRPDCGVNLDLHRTINFCRSGGECIALWGPYELNPEIAVEFYNKALKQIAKLNSGCVLYKAIDPDSGNISNCMHAVSDLDGISRRSLMYDEIRHYGFAASANVARVLTGSGRVDWTVTHDWLIEALDLKKYCLQQRKLVPNCR